MARKKVLVVGMLDSIHLARWIKQFVGAEFDILVFPSSYFKFMHPNIHEFKNSNIHIGGAAFLKSFLGYIDSLVTFRFFGNQVGQFMRRFYLLLVVAIYRPDVIHAIEIQHAGYLVSSIKGTSQRRILTNWGSDIYFFQHHIGHQTRIRKALGWATHYSAECTRDYHLAKTFGFAGVELPKIPNAGGLVQNHLYNLPISNRSQLIVKCYGGTFGLGSMAIEVCEIFLSAQENANIFLYSVTDDLLENLKQLMIRFPKRIRYSTLSDPLSHDEILAEFGKSRVYLGMSRSDGLSTSFLESIALGAYPIQTNTSCASEIIELGAIGSIVNPDINEVVEILLRVFTDEILLAKSRENNLLLASQIHDYSRISSIANTYYE